MAKTTEINLTAVNLIAHSTSVKGDLQTESDIRVDGTLKGNLTTSGRLIIGQNGMIEGDIQCKTAEIEGQLTGKIHVAELMALKSTARFNGEMVTSQLLIEPGALFTGQCSMQQKG
ncbi:MAG TPA: polymer-forming cytoskeletal protein [Prolixibacteraceae bacterium]|nr:polymer-forming cytoskeletal protein [Prolixibacteraceae bacterium]